MHPVARIRVPLSTIVLGSNRPAASTLSYLQDKQQLTYWNRPFTCTAAIRKEDYAKATKALNQKGSDDHENDLHKQFGDTMEEAEEKQVRAPWNREGSDKPPVKRLRSAGAMTKGKLLTTPSRLLKLILPLTTEDHNSDRKSIEPLALLVHPQQPLSYLERLIQAELPMIKSKDGKDRIPEVYFRAEDSAQDEEAISKAKEKAEQEEEGSDEQMIDGKLVKLGKIKSDSDSSESSSKEPKSEKKQADSLDELEKKENIQSGLRGGPGEGGVETYSGMGREGASTDPKHKEFVRWSSSTEIGDFIRDAARGSEFAVEIEGAEKSIYVGVPSFNDRTHYLRVRLRKTSKRLHNLATVKKECDDLAHRSAQRLAMSGFALLLCWWGAIYHFTFQTPYGWDTMEPITYLAGLSSLMIGYLWFLYHNREVSYRAALNLTVSKRQNALYQARGFDVGKWEGLIEEGNALRKEIKAVAEEYDVEWDETKDEGSKMVSDALRKERRKRGEKEQDDDDDDLDDDDEGKKRKSIGSDEGDSGKEKEKNKDD